MFNAFNNRRAKLALKLQKLKQFCFIFTIIKLCGNISGHCPNQIIL
jgi:hypothetical protein